MTPISRLDNDRYNNVHRKTNVIVQQLFGIWKRSFPCSHYGLRTQLTISTSVAIICATAVLHNISIHHALKEIEEEYI